MNVLQDPDYGRLKNYLIASTGLAFYADRDKLLTELLSGRISDLGLPGCASYARFLADAGADSAEMDLLIARLTIGETYFFRTEEQFAAIRDIILPDILKRQESSRQLNIWSAGCATGAEPYSLAILLTQELGHRAADWQVGILATDLNRGYLTQAAEGKFRAWALRSTSDEVKRECFSQEGLTWTIHPRYKQWISFQYMNLAESAFSAPGTVGTSFDLILCRNVMLYFAHEVSRRLVGHFHEALGEGGWLVVGAPEHNLDRYQAFHAVNASGGRLYQKMTVPSEPVQVTLEPPMPAPRPPAALPRVEREGLRQLTDCGDWQGAAEYGQRTVRDATDGPLELERRMEAVWRERARRLSLRPAPEGAGQNAWPVIVLGIANERYGIDLPDVAEVLPTVRATPVPGAPAAVAGVINVHNEIRPVLDLRRLLGMEADRSGHPARVILLRKDSRLVGLRIDSVEQVRWIASGDLQIAGNGAAGASRYVKGSTRDLLLLLNTDSLFAEIHTGVIT